MNGIRFYPRPAKIMNRNKYLIIYWIFPLLLAVYALVGEPNTPGFIGWVMAASLGIGVVLAAVRHDPLSLVAIVSLVHALFYPIPVVLNLLLDHHVLYDPSLWPPTPLAMKACSVGMLGFALGSFGHDIFVRPASANRISACDEALNVPVWKYVFLCSLIVPLALFRIKKEFYYHILAAGAKGVSMDNALSYAWTGYVEYVIYAAIFLQWRRFFITQSRRDLWAALFCAFLPVVVMLPSGSRDAALVGPVVSVTVATLGYGRLAKLRTLAVLLGTFLLALYLMAAMAAYRGRIAYDVRDASVTQRLKFMKEEIGSSAPEKRSSKEFLELWAARFADYIAVGRIVDEFPDRYPFRGFEDSHYWFNYLFPSPFRSPTPDFDPRDGAILCKNIGFDNIGGGGSQPAMILGDLFSRFGWWGVFLGMGLGGFLLRTLDHWLSSGSLFKTILFALLLPTVRHLPFDTVFLWLLFFTRALAVNLALAWGMTWFFRKVSIPRRVRVEGL